LFKLFANILDRRYPFFETLKAKPLFPEIQKQRLLIFSFLLSFLFSGIGVVQGLPIFITTISPAHPFFISKNNHTIRLTLHHPGNHDEHEVRTSYQHQHDLLDQVLAASKRGKFSHSDHEIEIPPFKERLSTTSKAKIILDNQPLFITNNIVAISTPPNLFLPLGHAPPNPSRPTFPTVRPFSLPETSKKLLYSALQLKPERTLRERKQNEL